MQVRLRALRVPVTIVDLVTVRQFNLYAEVLAFVVHNDPTMIDPAPRIYAASCRWVKKEKRHILEACLKSRRSVTAADTTLWLTADLYVPLDLEKSYEEDCHDLWIA
jgi:hypothetical protein